MRELCYNRASCRSDTEWRSVRLKLEDIIDPVPLAYKQHFSKDEFEKIQAGFHPCDMDDKWFIRFEEPYLWFHRSWTGQSIFRVEITSDADGFSIKEALCTNAMLATGGHEHQSDLLEFLIGNLLLGRNLPFPNHNNDDDTHPGLYQHVVSGTGYPEKGAKPMLTDGASRKRWWQFWR